MKTPKILIFALFGLFACRSNNPKAWKIEVDPNADLDTVESVQLSVSANFTNR